MAGDSTLIRRATAADLPAIGAIQGGSGWPPESYLSYDCRVAIQNGCVAGFLVSREIAPGEREILNVVVDPASRRRGIGKKLLEAEISGARGNWYLEVRESNQAAIKLYESMGFRATGRRPDYYLDPPEMAIVMSFFS
ncbi:MAG TPA: ribosomal protein S18-alanine N-acetyltransferase [Bryobacteraceae bacterium]|nr:ribosomal protein S18-alanine N-acetyltransferase [Bryobacteraceae bacterium]